MDGAENEQDALLYSELPVIKTKSGIESSLAFAAKNAVLVMCQENGHNVENYIIACQVCTTAPNWALIYNDIVIVQGSLEGNELVITVKEEMAIDQHIYPAIKLARPLKAKLSNVWHESYSFETMHELRISRFVDVKKYRGSGGVKDNGNGKNKGKGKGRSST